MLTKSVWLVCCLWLSNSMVKSQLVTETNCTVGDDELPEVQSGLNNFIIDTLVTVPFAYALDQCTGTTVGATGRWYRYECDMDSNTGNSAVIKTEYFTEDCSDAGSVVTVFNGTNITEGQIGFFECEGSSTYAKIRLSFDADCENSVVIYAALGACSNVSPVSQINFYCSAEEAIAQIFTLDQVPMSTTFLPSSTSSTDFNATLPTDFNATLPTDFNATLPTDFNATLPSLLNATLPTLLNATLPTLFNATLPTLLNATLPTLFNATMSTMFNATLPTMSTTQINIMMCEDDSFCDRWLLSNQCNLINMAVFGFNQEIYGLFEECSIIVGMSSSTTMTATEFNATEFNATEFNATEFNATEFNTTEFNATEFNTTFIDDNITVTEPSIITSTSGVSTSSTSSTTTTRGTETTSGAVRPSLLFTVGMCFSFFFLVSV